MKIVFVVSGSIESNFSYRVLSLAKALHKVGHETVIIAPKADKYNDFQPKIIREIDGVKIVQPFQFDTRRLEINLVPYIVSAIRAVLKEKADLVYIYKPTPISILGLLAKLIHRTPTVLDMDDLGSEVMAIEGHPKYQQVLVRFCERVGSAYADKLVVASTFLENIQKKTHPNKSIYVLPNGVDSDWLSRPLTSSLAPCVVFFGAMNRKSILDPLLTSLASLKPTIKKQGNRVIIMGDGAYLDYFKKRSASLNLSDIITFTGWLTLSEAKANLRSQDIGYCCMPNTRTTRAASNMKVTQYMARGVIPLVSPVGDLSSTVGDGSAGYIATSHQVSAITEALRLALRDGVSRKTKAQSAHRRAREMYSWDILADGFLGWIDSSAASSEK